MEKYPLEIWDHLVCKTLYPVKLKNDLTGNGTIASLLEESKNAREQARSWLIRESVLHKTKQEIKILVEQHQIFFANLLDIVFEYQSDPEIPFELQKVYEQVASDMEILMRLLETSFSDYFNPNGKVPNFIRAKFEKTIKPQLSKIKKRLGDQEKNQHLVESLFAVIDSFLQPSGYDVLNFRQLSYFKHLIVAVGKWNPELFKDSKFSPAIELFIALKFNDESFIQHIIKTVKEALSAVESEEQQFILLKEYYKCTSQILESSPEPLYSEKPSVKEIVLDWLAQEIYFLETSYPKKENTSADTSVKINTSLSVPVLALYIRLFKEAGIITNSNHSELFRAVSSTFTTHRKAEATHSHLHSKFYSIEESARRKVFDQLMNMAHLCKRLG